VTSMPTRRIGRTDGDGRALPVLPGPLERLRWFELPPSMPCRPLLYDLARGR
jgi:hypothetical protein